MGRKRISHRIETMMRLLAARERGGEGVQSRLPGLSRSNDEDAIARNPLSFDDLALESRLVWMLGSPRTGSTWLLRMLVYPWILTRGSVAGLKAPPRFRRKQLPNVVAINESYVMHHLTPLREPPGRGTELLLNGARGADLDYFFSDPYAASWRPHLRRLILARLVAQAENAATDLGLRDPLVLVKEPNGSHGAELLMSLLPHSRLLFILRDGRDVVDSMLDARREGGWVGDADGLRPEARERRLGFVRRQADLWMERTLAVERAYAAHPPPLRLLTRYEDLRRDPEPELERIFTWLGREPAPGDVHAAVAANSFEALPKFAKGPGTPRRAASPGLWRQNLSAEEQKVMAEVMAEKLVQFGYDA